jgi:hypothetical protein
MADYKYFMAGNSLNLPFKESVIRDFQALLDEQFSLASDYWTISEEDSIGSQTYHDVNVRIVTHVVNSATGKYLGDDYRQLLFPDLTHAVGLGFLYWFDNNYFITINTEKTKNLAAGSIIKRCNNVLKWIDSDTGALYEEYCNIDYEILRNVNNDSPSNLIVTPSGRTEILVQFNDRTNTIKPNQRFLFGNSGHYVAYKLVGGGINSYQNTSTTDNMSVGFLRLTVVVDYTATDNDDLVNGIADVGKLDYSLSLIPSTITGVYGTTGIQLFPTVTLNGENVTRTVDWTSSNTGIAIIGATGIASGQTGIPSLLTLGTTGTAIVTASLDGNTGIHAHLGVTVTGSSSNIYEVVINPNKNYILEGDTQTYNVYLYLNGIQQANKFTFGVDARTVPVGDFAFSFSASPGNTFTVENIAKCLTDYIVVTCTTTVSAVDYIGSLKIYLRGTW